MTWLRLRTTRKYNFPLELPYYAQRNIQFQFIMKCCYKLITAKQSKLIPILKSVSWHPAADSSLHDQRSNDRIPKSHRGQHYLAHDQPLRAKSEIYPRPSSGNDASPAAASLIPEGARNLHGAINYVFMHGLVLVAP